MRIGIDARVLDRPITGTGRYLLNILRELPYIDHINEYYLFTCNDLNVNKEFFKIVTQKKSIFPMKLFSPIWLNIVLPKLVNKYRIDILCAPNIIVPMKNLPNTKKLSIVHDVIPRIYKEYYPFFYKIYLSVFLNRSLNKSDLIVTVSEHSKKDIIKYYRIPSDKIRVAYNTASDIFNNRAIDNEELLKLFKDCPLPKKYLLYVGVIEKRKNIIGLIKIFDLIREQGSALELLIVGKPGYDFNNILPEINKRNDSIRYYKYLDDRSLAYAFKNAFAFIFPSYYEGFGIPPLEAMQSGIPVLSSNTSSLVEVVGDGGLLHPPEDYIGFANDILKLENEPAFYADMKLKAIEQSKKFNIKETTQKLVNAFNEL